MAEYIEREAFIKHYRKLLCEDCGRRKGMKNGKLKFCYAIGEAPCRACAIDDMLTFVEDFPAADVEEVKRGKWEQHDYYDENSNTYVCSVCEEPWTLIAGTPSENNMHYCPNCGARMVADGE